MMKSKCFFDDGYGFFDGLKPNTIYPRGAFLHGLVQYAGLSPVPYRNTFSDLTADDSYAGDWQRAWDEHWLDYGNGLVRSSEPVTEQEWIALFARVTDLPQTDALWHEATVDCPLRSDGTMTVEQAHIRLVRLLEALERRLFAEPTAKFRIHPMEHQMSSNSDTVKSLVKDTYAGGAVINAAWEDGWNENPANLDKLYDTAKKMAENGLHAWLYDELVYPSGWAGGYILKDGKDYLAKNIGILRLSGEGCCSVEQPLPEKGIAFVQAAFYRNGDYAHPLEAAWTADMVNAQAPEGEWELLAFYIRPCNIWPYAFATTISPPIGPREHLNFLNRDAVATFIEGALTRVRDHNPDFDRLFEAVFTDEPSLQSIYIYGDANKPSFRSVPYGDELFACYQEWQGEDLHPLLPYLFFGNDERARSVRVSYYRTIARMMSENFTGQVADWCHKSHVNYSGHYHSEEHLYFHVGNYGDFMQVISQADRPGFDMLCGSHKHFWEKGEGVNNGASFLAGKYVSSVSRIKGGNTTMVEVCPVMHETEMKEDIEDAFTGLSTDCAFVGATHFNNYGYHFILDPDIFRRWNTYTGRLCYMLRGSRSDAQIAIYYPIADAQAAMYEPNAAMDMLTSEELSLNDYLENLQYNLLINRLDYNLLSEQAVLDGSISEDGLCCGKTTYRVLLMPRVTVVSQAVMERLQMFRLNGGTVLWLDSLPYMGLNIAEHETVRRLAEEMADDLVVFRPDNLALHATVTASSTDEVGGYRPEYVTNGSIETDFSWEGWSTNILPATLEVELPEETVVNRLDTYFKKDYEQIGFTAYWQQGEKWIPLAKVTDNVSTHCYREFTPVKTKRLRLCFEQGSRQQPQVARLTEIQLYNVRYTPTSEDLMTQLHRRLNTTLQVEQPEQGSVFVSQYRRGNHRLYYIINRTDRKQIITLIEQGKNRCRLYQPLDGTITETSGKLTLSLDGGRGIFWEILED